MRLNHWSVLGGVAVIAGCTSIATTTATTTATTRAPAPLGAPLTANAPTGAPVPLRFDPTARVIRSTAAGLPAASYLPTQATHGKQVYEQTCATCHLPNQFVGQNFVDDWNDRRIYDFYALVRATMPLDDPGGLKEQEYLDVVAYLLQANHHTAPSLDSLRADTTALRGHRIAVSVP